MQLALVLPSLRQHVSYTQTGAEIPATFQAGKLAAKIIFISVSFSRSFRGR